MTTELDSNEPGADPGTGRARRPGDRAAWSGLAAMTVTGRPVHGFQGRCTTNRSR